MAELRTDLCPNGAIIDLSSLKVSYDLYFRTTSGSNFNSAEIWFVADGTVVTACVTSAGPNQWTTLTCSSFPTSATRLTLAIRLNQAPWVGTIFLDNIHFSSK